eukprot:TRINITY_DN9501_c0_g1_i1.p1 TRINITY_DN9501_c0_g1~~TRINITY_DN9501_c0_g1_i1.p1  ORF type:complete len:512 (-),score=95.28 TRINITY_DN9501_c0_g1_i1:647-2182(-)
MLLRKYLRRNHIQRCHYRKLATPLYNRKLRIYTPMRFYCSNKLDNQNEFMADPNFLFAATSNDDDASLHYLERSANDGSVGALLEIGKIYYEKNNIPEAEKYFQKAADKGNLDASSLINYMILKDEIKGDHQQAVSNMKTLAEQGHLYCQYFLFRLYQSGLYNNEKNQQLAIKYGLLATEMGDILVLREVADEMFKYYISSSNEEYAKKAYDLLTVGANNNDMKCISAIGEMMLVKIADYMHDEDLIRYFDYGISNNDVACSLYKAITLFRTDPTSLIGVELLTYAANQGNSNACFVLGNTLYHRENNEEKQKGLEYILTAAKEGHMRSAIIVGELFLELKNSSKDLGMLDEETVSKLLMKQITNHQSADCSYIMAHIKLADGHITESIKWLFTANRFGNVKSNFAIYEAYNSGIGVKQDKLEANRWLLNGAELGEPHCQLQIGKLCYMGEGFEKDSVEAFSWFIKSADQGVAEACNIVSKMYSDGVGTDVDVEKADQYKQMAEELLKNRK